MKNDTIWFHNLQEDQMTFEEVFYIILKFMHSDPSGNYRLMIGTDSQVHQKTTLFITGIVILNQGSGFWACKRKIVVPNKMKNLHERISYEISLSEEIVSLFKQRKKRFMNVIRPYIHQGASFSMEGHLDIGAGKKNKTRKFVKEMVTRIEAMGAEPKIKPNAFVASCYANRFTK